MTKIKVADILAVARPDKALTTYLGRTGLSVGELVTVEPLRGHGYDAELTAFFVRVASNHHRNRIHAAWEQRIAGENWRAELTAALEVARHRAKSFADEQRATRDRIRGLEAARIEYAVQLGKKIGRTVATHRVVHNETGPVGVSFQLTLNGTVDEVAEKFARVEALTAEFRNRYSL